MKLTVTEVMTSSVVTIHADAKIDEAFALFLRHQVSGLPVVDDQNRLVGIISELDLLRLLYDPQTDIDRVLDYASTNVVSVTMETSILDAVEILLSQPYRRLPVVDDDNRLVGIVSRRDVVRFIRDVRMKIASVLRRRRHLGQPHTLPT